MTKPWEETWEAVPAMGGDGIDVVADGDRMRIGHIDGPRARLAAAAPDLVRVLLAVEWSGYLGECPVCSSGEPRGHAASCPLDAALRKAVVR